MPEPEPVMPAVEVPATPRPARGRGLGLAPKILGVVALLATLSVGIVVGAGTTLSNQGAQLERLERRADIGISMGRANANYLAWVRAVEMLPLELSAEERRHWEEAAAESLQRLEKRVEEFRPNLVVAENRRDLQAFESAVMAYRSVQAQVQDRSRAGKLDEA